MTGIRPAPFDPGAYKERSRRAWNRTAAAWHRWGPVIEAWLRPATAAMMDMAGIRPGSRVLDVGAGAGEPAATIARRVGPGGAVLAADISPAMVELAALHARGAGLSNVRAQVMDGEALEELPPASFDAAVSRLGVVHFPDRVGTLRRMRAALREGGRASVVGLAPPAANPFLAITIGVIYRRVQLPPPPPGGPGPFSLGSERLMREALEAAAFAGIEVAMVDAPMRMASAAECARFQREALGGLDDLMSDLPEARRDEVWREVARELRVLERGGELVSPAQLIVGSGVRA